MQTSHARPSLSAAKCIRGRVPVIDNDAGIRAVIADFLAAEGCAVESAA